MISQRALCCTLRSGGLVLVASLAVACQPGSPVDTTTPVTDPGTMQVNVTQIPATTGIVLVEVSGGPITQIVPAPGLTATVSSIDANRVALMIRGAHTAGTLGTITVPDRNVSYSVTVVDAAANQAGGYARLAASQFQFAVQR